MEFIVGATWDGEVLRLHQRLPLPPGTEVDIVKVTPVGPAVSSDDEDRDGPRADVPGA